MKTRCPRRAVKDFTAMWHWARSWRMLTALKICVFSVQQSIEFYAVVEYVGRLGQFEVVYKVKWS